MNASDEEELLPLPNDRIITLSSAEARVLWSVYFVGPGNPDPDDLDPVHLDELDEARQILKRLNKEAVAHIQALMDAGRQQPREEPQRQLKSQDS